jgi:hypothetical protein
MPKRPPPDPKLLLFCRALHDEETGGPLHWTLIATVARRLEMDEREAILLAGDCAAAGLVWLDVRGPPYAQLPSSARLTEKGWKSVIASKRPTSAPKRQKALR